MQLTAPRLVSPLAVATTSSLQPRAPSSAVAHLILVRPMRASAVLWLTVSLLLFCYASCAKRAAPKFQPGDRVRVKATHIEGSVCLRTRLFHDYRYWVTLPGNYYVLFAAAERERREASDAQYHITPARSNHDEGPFDEAELELAR
jgi:hypothetical protein